MKQYKQPKGITKLFRKVFYGKYANWPKTAWFHWFIRNSAFKKVRERAQNAESKPLKVVFFVLNISMWKYESLFKLMLADERFDPVIIPYPLLWLSDEDLKKNETSIVNYCIKNGFKYTIGFDIQSKRYLTAKDIAADFVSYSQPYNNCPDFWKVEKFYRNSLIFTYPYGLPIDNNAHFNNLLSQNVSWKLFYTTDVSRKVFEHNPITHGKNYLTVGSVIYDKLQNRNPSFSAWKLSNTSHKRVIWAPHHTINDTDDLPFSTFLSVSGTMLDIARKYSDRIQFAFKPHPMLYNRLVSKWGQTKTDEYYSTWKNMPNTSLVLDDYTDLFLTSDAMLHDCAGFTMEYLFTQKPVLFLSKPKTASYFVGFSKQCFNQHYTAFSEIDIIDFLDRVVISGNDEKRVERESFYTRELLPPGNNTAAINMFLEFKKVLK